MQKGKMQKLSHIFTSLQKSEQHVNWCAMQVATHQGQEGIDNPVLFAGSLKVRKQHKANFSQALKRLLSLRRFLFPQMKATAVVRGSSCKASGGQARLRHFQSDIIHG